MDTQCSGKGFIVGAPKLLLFIAPGFIDKPTNADDDDCYDKKKKKFIYTGHTYPL